MNQSTLLHNISPDDFLSKMKQIVADMLINIPPQIQIEKADELMTKQEVATYFKRTTETIADWTSKGYIQLYGIGTAEYYKRREIENAVIPLNPRR
jgi:hypothetical protein